MIPPLPIGTYLTALNMLTLILRWWHVRRRNSYGSLTELQQLIQISITLTVNWLQLLQIVRRYLLWRKKRRLYKPPLLLQLLAGYRSTSLAQDVWQNLSRNWSHFFWLTGETPQTLADLVNNLENTYVPDLTCGRLPVISVRNQVLLTFIWLRRFLTLAHLSMHFDIPLSSCHRFIHKWMKILHCYLVPRYISWHGNNYWQRLAGTYPEWPHVVGILDCTPFKISKPKGGMQRLFYRRDRHCFFLNWLVIVDVLGQVVLSCPGFSGRAADATCLSSVNIPPLPAGLQIMADQGFPHRLPVMVLHMLISLKYLDA